MSVRRRAPLLTLALLTAVHSAHAQDDAERRDARPRTTVAGEFGYTSFRDATDPWQQASISLAHRTALGPVIARVNEARRFGTSGVQLEGEAYPRLSRTLYAYLDLGYSAARVYPGWRSGAELFASLPGAWETSGGYRQLRFEGAPVTLLTGSVGRYVGDYWFSLRPWIRTGSAATAGSVSTAARRYGADADHFIGVRAGFGSTPGDQLAPDQATRSTAWSAAVHGSATVTGATLGTWSLGYDRETLPAARSRTSITTLVGLKRAL